MKDKLITSAYPRSGSTYLNQALNLLYYPEDNANECRHEVNAIEKTNLILVPFRNPLDSIASWHKYPSRENLIADIKFYVRFYSAVLDNLHKVVLMDFDLFTKDINYIKTTISQHFNFDSVNEVTDKEIKSAMIENAREINLPRNNQDELNAIKDQLQAMPEFKQCVDLYEKLKIAAN